MSDKGIEHDLIKGDPFEGYQFGNVFSSVYETLSLDFLVGVIKKV